MPDQTADEQQAQALSAHVGDQVARAGWGPAEALTWAAGKDADEVFLCAVMLSRLCADPIARAQPLHGRLHRGYGLSGCAGPDLVTATQRSLGISDARAARLIEALDAGARTFAGLTGTED
jgi:hypothetical protein